jgi:hypothetical protein
MQNKMNSFIFYAEVQPIFAFWAKIVQTYEISATFATRKTPKRQQNGYYKRRIRHQ